MISCVCKRHTFLSSTPPCCTHKNFPHVFHSNHQKKKSRVLVAIKDTVSFNLLDSLINPEGRFILVAEINNTTYTLLALYSPNVHQQRLLRKTLSKACNIQKGYLLCGDFNASMDPAMYFTAKNKRKKTGLNSFFFQEDLYLEMPAYFRAGLLLLL